MRAGNQPIFFPLPSAILTSTTVMAAAAQRGLPWRKQTCEVVCGEMLIWHTHCGVNNSLRLPPFLCLCPLSKNEPKIFFYDVGEGGRGWAQITSEYALYCPHKEKERETNAITDTKSTDLFTAHRQSSRLCRWKLDGLVGSTASHVVLDCLWWRVGVGGVKAVRPAHKGGASNNTE